MKYKGTLQKPIARKPHRLLLAEALRGESELMGAPYKEMMDKLPALFAAHSVPEGDWASLAIALAREHVPGFRIVNPAGRKTEWSPFDKAEFRYDVEAILRDAPDQAVTEAIRKGARLERWAEKTKGMKVTALSKHYYSGNPKFFQIIEDARSYNLFIGKD